MMAQYNKRVYDDTRRSKAKKWRRAFCSAGLSRGKMAYIGKGDNCDGGIHHAPLITHKNTAIFLMAALIVFKAYLNAL